MSQNDTIELRGFDDEKPKKKRTSPSRLKRCKDWAKKKELQQNTEEEKDEVKEPTNRSTPTLQMDMEQNVCITINNQLYFIFICHI